MEAERTWETIGISNDYLFGKIMRTHPGLCQKLLQRILPELPIDHIEVIETQKSINEDIDARSVRLDAYVRDAQERVYSIEMQMTDTKELPKRSRYYSAMIDLQLLDKGMKYSCLNDSYIIFICPFDLYGKGRHQYTFDGRCREDAEITIEDGATRIFLNTKGTMDDVSSSLRAFLDYVNGTLSDDIFVEELNEAVGEARKNREWRHEFMTLALRDQENIEKGIAIGRAEGREEGRAEGREEGRAEGRAEGREEGRAEGKQEERQTGIRLLVSSIRAIGFSDEVVVEQLKQQYQLTEEEAKKYLG